MSERTFIFCPVLKNETVGARSVDARVEEALNLAAAIDLDVFAAEPVYMDTVRPSTFIGKGAVERIGEALKNNEASLVIADCALSPVQQRNLEKAWQCKVIDRTALILEIFGERARTKEGVLQVELAHLNYQKSRLVRSWTHLERQKGGRGFLGGPGETQIELDRRVITETIVKLKKELEEVKRTRHIHRRARQRVPYPVVALVGYTNAGKSTLFNRLTNAGVFAKDQLFATLDPTMRLIKLPSGRKVILSDTVGFVSNLPTELVAAFRATLEEVLEASLIVHVRDSAHADSAAQKQDVENVLRELGLGSKIEQGLLEAMNKIDLLDEQERSALMNVASRKSLVIPVSALTGQGVENLLQAVEDALSAGRREVELSLPVSDGAALAYLYRNAEVLKRADDDECCRLTVRMDDAELARLQSHYPEVSHENPRFESCQ